MKKIQQRKRRNSVAPSWPIRMGSRKKERERRRKTEKKE